MSTDTAHRPLATLRRPARYQIRAGVALGTIGALTTLVPYVGLTELARALMAPTPDGARVALIVAVIVLALLAGWLCTGVGFWLTHLADHRVQTALRRALVDRLGRVPLGWFTDKASGQVRKAVQDDLTDLHHLTAHHEVERAGAVALPAAGIVYLLILNWRLAVLAVLTLPVYLLAYAWMMRGFGEKMTQLDASFTRVSAAIAEFVYGIATVKAFGRSDHAHQAYENAVSRFSHRYAGWVRPLLRLEALSSLAISTPVIMLVSLAGGCWMLAQGWVTPIELLAQVLIALAIPQTLQALNQSFTAQRRAQAAAARIDALLRQPTLSRPARPKKSPNDAGIVFERVDFGYDARAPVLHGIDLVCRPESLTALVGASGAGKSSLARLVPRFYDVTVGSVRIGGVDVREIDPSLLYRQVGFVLQDVQLVNGTVADNLRLGRPEASNEQVYAAARAARIHERIAALPKGYDAMIGVDVMLSGGEAQRVTIARALLADTPILVLDEATAHTDPDCEAEIQDALSTLAHGRTVLVIAHRLASITAADQIVVLDRGRVVQIGSHDALRAEDGPYRRMWQAEQAEPAAADTHRIAETRPC